jgi:hypothetical protein
VSSAVSITVPTGATLGTVSATQSRLVVLALNNAGTIELAVVNISGGNDLSETGLISTTAISAAATSASVVYSTAARTSVAYRVIGYVESTQATAGTWATAPSTIQGYGGQALAAMSSLGYRAYSANLSGSKALGTTYYNTQGCPRWVFVQVVTASTGQYIYPTVNGVQLGQVVVPQNAYIFCPILVPPYQSYQMAQTGGAITISTWFEA